LPAPSQPGDGADHDPRGAGFELLERGDLAGARVELERLVRDRPDDREALSYLGVCLLQLGEPEEALDHLEHVCALEPDEGLHHWNVAAAAKAADRMTRGYLALERYLELPDGYAGHGARRREARRFLRSYEKVIADMHPGVAIGDVLEGEQLFIRAFEAMSARRFDEAAVGFRRIVVLLPHHYPSWGNLGAAELALGRTDEAARCLRRALELKPDYQLARENLELIDTRH
jgi:Flp pilus assembly protein TadD